MARQSKKDEVPKIKKDEVPNLGTEEKDSVESEPIETTGEATPKVAEVKISVSTEKPGHCEVCGEAMPRGEEMFRYHGYSGPCPRDANADHQNHPKFSKYKKEGQ